MIRKKIKKGEEKLFKSNAKLKGLNFKLEYNTNKEIYGYSSKKSIVVLTSIALKFC